MNSPYRSVAYGPIAYVLIVLAMVVGFFLTFTIASPVVDAVNALVGGLFEDALGLLN